MSETFSRSNLILDHHQSASDTTYNEFTQTTVDRRNTSKIEQLCTELSILLVEHLTGEALPDVDRAEYAQRISDGDIATLEPMAEALLTGILPDTIDRLPLLKQRSIDNFLDTGIKPVMHSLDSFREEVALSDETRPVSVYNKTLATADFLQAMTIQEIDIAKVVDNEIERNELSLRAFASVAAKQGYELDVVELMKIQPAIFEMLTSNDPLTTNDINYRLSANAVPGSAHSLYAPEVPDLDKLTSRYGNYTNFIEATGSLKRGGYASTFGFLHLVTKDADGNPFIIEHPHTMFDSEILSVSEELTAKLLTFELSFQRNHDMLHNILPVWAEHFMLHHPSAPITLGGHLPEYLSLAEGMRRDKSSYELALAILHRQIMAERFETEPGLYEQHLKTVSEILLELQHLQSNEVLSSHAVDHVSFVIMTNALNILPYNSSGFQALLDAYEALDLPATTVHPKDIYKLLVQQELICDPLSEALIQAGETKDQAIATACRATTDTLAIAALQDASFDTENSEQGADYVLEALHELGIEPAAMKSATTFSGRERLRWHSITASSRRLKGLNEKIHGLETVRYWDHQEEAFTQVSPVALISKFSAHFKDNAEEYEYRISLRLQSNHALTLFKSLIFSPEHSVNLISLEIATDSVFPILDQCILSLIDDSYMPLDNRHLIDRCIEELEQNGKSDTASLLQESMAIYDLLVDAPERQTASTGSDFAAARKQIVKHLMSLDG